VSGVESEAPEPEFFTAEDIRALAEQMEWLENGQIKEAVVCIEQHERPWAWIWVSQHNGPKAQVTFDPSFVATRAHEADQ
jgi:hypothetical protein